MPRKTDILNAERNRNTLQFPEEQGQTVSTEIWTNNMPRKTKNKLGTPSIMETQLRTNCVLREIMTSSAGREIRIDYVFS